MTPDLKERWDKLRRLDMYFWLACLGFPLSFVIAASMFGEKLGLGVAIAAAATCFATGLRRAAFRCPRCGNRFYIRERDSYSNPFAQHCLNCELTKWSDSAA